MNVLLLGGQGMAGHLAAACWLRHTDCRLTVTVRPGSRGANRVPQDGRIRVLALDVRDFAAVEQTVALARPALILNFTGVLNRLAEEHPRDAYLVNGLLPHWLAHLAAGCGARLIQISTDCVFSGDRGAYREDDQPDGTSAYARTKALGEVRDPRHLTLRTSIIGPDANPGGIGLLRWFLAQRGEVPGYRNVMWNGMTTLELAKATIWFAQRQSVGGIVHLAAPETVSKHDLLLLLQQTYGKRDVSVVGVEEPRLDRTLAVTRQDARYETPGYARMLREMREWEGGA